ncbi:S6OS1 protein, partial [Horornis vulcanius]|nr:S6OS1 protein [Horornis vulcanius]
KTLEEHRKKYTETPLAQKYYKKKAEVEEIQKRVLKCLEKYKWKEDACLDILGTAIVNAFTINASTRKKTQETLRLAEAARQENIKLEKEAEELQMKIDYLKKVTILILFYIDRVFEEREHSSLPKKKHQLYKTLHVPCLPQKFVQSVQSFRFSKQRAETG